jgi:hypothetical protein
MALVLAGWLTGLTGRGTAAPSLAAAGTDPYALARQRMVAEQLIPPGRDITNARVLAVMGRVPRHEFVPERLRADAYADHPLPIGHGQTISQPYIVAFMTEQLEPKPTHRVLEIGTGSGYQAAVLGEMVAEVYTMEIVGPRFTPWRLSKNWRSDPPLTYSGWDTLTCTSALATATGVGPRRRLSIPSSSHVRRNGSRSR